MPVLFNTRITLFSDPLIRFNNQISSQVPWGIMFSFTHQPFERVQWIVDNILEPYAQAEKVIVNVAINPSNGLLKVGAYVVLCGLPEISAEGVGLFPNAASFRGDVFFRGVSEFKPESTVRAGREFLVCAGLADQNLTPMALFDWHAIVTALSVPYHDLEKIIFAKPDALPN